MELCRVVESSCLPTHNIVPQISWHDLPCHRTTKRYSDFPSMVIFRLLLLKFWIQTWFCNCPQYLCLFHILVECNPNKHGQGKMLVLPNQLLCLVSTFHIGLIFCFFPANLMSSTYTDKNNPLLRCTNKHSQLETFSQAYFNRLSQIAFPITVLPKDDHTDFVRSRGTTGSSMLDHDFGHLCRVRRIQMSGHSDIEFSVVLEHLPL